MPSSCSALRGGVFVDVGVRRRLEHRNSYLLEGYYGWRGVCVEPGARQRLLASLRPQCINVMAPMSSTEQLVEFHKSAHGRAQRDRGDDDASGLADVEGSDVVRVRTSTINATLTAWRERPGRARRRRWRLSLGRHLRATPSSRHSAASRSIACGSASSRSSRTRRKRRWMASSTPRACGWRHYRDRRRLGDVDGAVAGQASAGDARVWAARSESRGCARVAASHEVARAQGARLIALIETRAKEALPSIDPGG